MIEDETYQAPSSNDGNIDPFSGTRKKKIVVDEGKCTGCRACEYACAFQQSKAFHYDFSLIRISKNKENEGFFLPTLCRQCEDPPCVAECPVDAMTQDDGTGIIKIDESLCTGCKMCLEACPWHVPNFRVRQKIATVCNLCQGEPLCVQYCSPGALIFEAAEEKP